MAARVLVIPPGLPGEELKHWLTSQGLRKAPSKPKRYALRGVAKQARMRMQFGKKLAANGKA